MFTLFDERVLSSYVWPRSIEFYFLFSLLILSSNKSIIDWCGFEANDEENKCTYIHIYPYVRHKESIYFSCPTTVMAWSDEKKTTMIMHSWLCKKTSRYSNNSLTNVSLDYSFMLNLPSCLTIRFFVHWQTISIANEWQAERERERTHQNVRSICFEIIVKQIRNQSLKTIRKRYLDICQIKKKKK